MRRQLPFSLGGERKHPALIHSRLRESLAQPPETNETFMREVDENLRRDQMEAFFKRYGGWVAGAVALFVLASGAFIYWNNLKQQRAERQVEQLSQTFSDIGSGNLATAPKQLDAVAENGSKGARAIALFTRAAVALQQNDVKLATAKYREVAEDSSMPKPFRDAALIRQTALEFDSLQPQQVITRLQPLAQPGNPWFGSAGEMTAIAHLKQGQRSSAGQMFLAIAKDKGVPEELRSRSAQLAGTLGVDASSALPPAQ